MAFQPVDGDVGQGGGAVGHGGFVQPDLGVVQGMGVNTLWISILYGSSFGALLLTRVMQCLVLIPVEFVVITAIAKFGKRIKV